MAKTGTPHRQQKSEMFQSNVKKCVDLHGGQIAIDSEVEIGTTFTVTLPMFNSLSTSAQLMTTLSNGQ
jgi:sensor histidine kinase regulating citrate/malate metabolism